MRLLKFALFGIVVAALTMAWGRRDDVVSAYTDEHESIDVQLQGVRAFEAGDAGPSPYVLASVVSNEVRTPTANPADTGPAPEISVVGGQAAIRGVVGDAEGFAVEAAFVRIERITSQGAAVVDVLTNAEGQFELNNVMGGRYRVRAFVPNVQRSVDVDVFALRENEAKQIDLRVAPAAERVVLQLTGPPEITMGFEGQPGRATVAVTVGRDVVDVEGHTVLVPVAGVPVDLLALASVRVASANPVTTDAAGAARFLIDCSLPGAHLVEAAAAETRQVLSLPTCVIPLPPEPEPEPEPDSENNAEAGQP